ncbi:hypothetical protein TNCV_368211 [Trichonephila clavipes]|nr:hypothetical protein TNCV_368211 [Trichonephila clavipes]
MSASSSSVIPTPLAHADNQEGHPSFWAQNSTSRQSGIVASDADCGAEGSGIKFFSLVLKHLRFDIFELQETRLAVRLINTTNERRLVQGHETPLRVKEDIEDVSSELDNGG